MKRPPGHPTTDQKLDRKLLTCDDENLIRFRRTTFYASLPHVYGLWTLRALTSDLWKDGKCKRKSCVK